MPGNPLEKRDFAVIRAKAATHSTCRIIVAHSAHPASLHIESFHLLEHLNDDDIEIICPLSYGIPEYRDKVIAEGRRIFGKKFIPLTEHMDKGEYIELLNTCDVGVYITRYQQGMGNISLLLRLGKKVYIREDNSMWQQYRLNLGYSVFPVSELENIPLKQLADFPQELAYNNIRIAEELAVGNQTAEQWRTVFED